MCRTINLFACWLVSSPYLHAVWQHCPCVAGSTRHTMKYTSAPSQWANNYGRDHPLLPASLCRCMCVCLCVTLYFKVKEPGHKYEAGCLLDLFSQWVIPTQARPILNKMALGQQFPAGLDCIIWLFWTCNSPVSELAAAIELLLPPICTQHTEWLLQPCPQCLLAEQYSSSQHTHTPF